MPLVTMIRSDPVQRCRLHRDIQVGIVEHDERVLAAQLELHLGHGGCGHLHDAAAGGGGAGKGHRIRPVDQRLAERATVAHHQVEAARRQPRFLEQLAQHHRAAGRELGRLQHHRVAVGECAGALPGRNGDREVPRRDRRDDAHRLVADKDIVPVAH
jgi:hypothetical protein